MDFVAAVLHASTADEVLICAQRLFNSLRDAKSALFELEKFCEHRDDLAELAGREIALRLVILELRLYFESCDADSFKALSFLSPSAPALSHVTPLMRIKYQDLLTDFQFLLSAKYLRLMDLVPKKINALAIPGGENAVVENVQLKILVYFLLGDSDFRDKSVLRYLAQENFLARYQGTPIEAFMALHERLIPYATFSGLLQYLLQFYLFRRVVELFRESLTENYLDTNLSKLPRYYSCVKIARIQLLFLYREDIDLESIICKMIIHSKFPAGSHIDQLQGTVHFSEPPHKYDDFNTHVKKICDSIRDCES